MGECSTSLSGVSCGIRAHSLHGGMHDDRRRESDRDREPVEAVPARRSKTRWGGRGNERLTIVREAAHCAESVGTLKWCEADLCLPSSRGSSNDLRTTCGTSGSICSWGCPRCA